MGGSFSTCCRKDAAVVRGHPVGLLASETDAVSLPWVLVASSPESRFTSWICCRRGPASRHSLSLCPRREPDLPARVSDVGRSAREGGRPAGGCRPSVPGAAWPLRRVSGRPLHPSGSSDCKLFFQRRSDPVPVSSFGDTSHVLRKSERYWRRAKTHIRLKKRIYLLNSQDKMEKN